jgi:hypothetical protein
MDLLRNILAIPAGWFIGSIVNIALVNAGPMVFPPPEGADITSMEALKATIHLFEPQHFIFPFLAHALGTLVGAVVAAKLAVKYHARFALAVGVLFFVGGTVAVAMIGGPMWFNILDLVAAYLPMGYLGGRIAAMIGTPSTPTPAA